jgi:hypothetical protein
MNCFEALLHELRVSIFADPVATNQVGRDELVKKATILSGTVHNNHRLLESFVSLPHYITKTLLSCLSDALKVDNYVRFENHHRDSEPSNTTLSLLHQRMQTLLTSATINTPTLVH